MCQTLKLMKQIHLFKKGFVIFLKGATFSDFIEIRLSNYKPLAIRIRFSLCWRIFFQLGSNLIKQCADIIFLDFDFAGIHFSIELKIFFGHVIFFNMVRNELIFRILYFIRMALVGKDQKRIWIDLERLEKFDISIGLRSMTEFTFSLVLTQPAQYHYQLTKCVTTKSFHFTVHIGIISKRTQA